MCYVWQWRGGEAKRVSEMNEVHTIKNNARYLVKMCDTSKKQAVIDLPERHRVTVNLYNGSPYFHIKNIYNGKTVSLGYNDMKSMIQQFPDMIERLKKMKKRSSDAMDHDGFEKHSSPRKKFKKSIVTISDDDDDDADEDMKDDF